jgi:triosephosphate isomerase
LVKDANCDVALCVPAILIPAISKAVKGTNIKLGAENVHWAESGAYTGEISCTMLKRVRRKLCHNRSQRTQTILWRNRRGRK